MPQQSSRSFTASFRGQCAAECGDPIREGDDVRYVADELMHDECVPYGMHPDDRRAERAEPTVCPSCRIAHAGDCY